MIVGLYFNLVMMLMHSSGSDCRFNSIVKMIAIVHSS